MPYIEQRLREFVDPHVHKLADTIGNVTKTETDVAGVLNYSITTLINKLYPRIRYWKLALIIGILVTIILEFYRRRGVPYEKEKCDEHGDVFF